MAQYRCLLQEFYLIAFFWMFLSILLNATRNVNWESPLICIVHRTLQTTLGVVLDATILQFYCFSKVMHHRTGSWRNLVFLYTWTVQSKRGKDSAIPMDGRYRIVWGFFSIEILYIIFEWIYFGRIPISLCFLCTFHLLNQLWLLSRYISINTLFYIRLYILLSGVKSKALPQCMKRFDCSLWHVCSVFLQGNISAVLCTHSTYVSLEALGWSGMSLPCTLGLRDLLSVPRLWFLFHTSKGSQISLNS